MKNEKKSILVIEDMSYDEVLDGTLGAIENTSISLGISFGVQRSEFLREDVFYMVWESDMNDYIYVFNDERHGLIYILIVTCSNDFNEVFLSEINSLMKVATLEDIQEKAEKCESDFGSAFYALITASSNEKNERTIKILMEALNDENKERQEAAIISAISYKMHDFSKELLRLSEGDISEQMKNIIIYATKGEKFNRRK